MKNRILGSLLCLTVMLPTFATVTYTAEETDSLFFLLTDEQKLGYCDLYREELNTIESLKDKCTDFGLEVIDRENIVVVIGNGGGASTNRILDAILAKLEGNIETTLDLRSNNQDYDIMEAFRDVSNIRFNLQTQPKSISEMFNDQLRESGLIPLSPLDPQRLSDIDAEQIEELLRINPVVLREVPIQERR